MKSLFLGIVLIIIVGIGGLVYRNAVEHPDQPIACPLDAQLCPDGTSVGRTGASCTFAACPFPNITLADPVSISFALPAGFGDAQAFDSSTVAAYELSSTASSTDASTTPSSSARIELRRYAIDASSSALTTMQQTAISEASGLPVSATSFSSSFIGTHHFTVVTIQRFEGTIDTAYYLARATDVLRFDAIDSGVVNWSSTSLQVSTLPAHAALLKLLGNLEGA